MASVANGTMAPTRRVYVFEQLQYDDHARCELCKEQPAAFQWMERNTSSEREREGMVCRICAAMIFLTGLDGEVART